MKNAAREIVILVGSLACLAGSAQPATYWVSPEGRAQWAEAKSDVPLDGSAASSLAMANANAAAGDLVYFRGGEYWITSQYGVGLNPENSGTPFARMIFKAFETEQPIITASAPYTYAIFLSNCDYAVIDGLSVKNTHVWMYIINNSDHNEVVNCTFANDTGEEGSIGLNIWEMCAGGMTFTCPSSHNWIHRNRFTRIHAYPAGRSCVEGADVLRIGGDQTGFSGGNDYNTIEDNYIAYAGHALFDSYSRYNVFRNNVLHNEPWITDYSGSTCSKPAIYTDPAYNGKFGHRCMQITGALYPETGTRDLIEGNRIGYAGVNPNNPGAINLEIAAAKNIVRFNYLYGAMRLGIGFKYAYSGDNRIYRNTLFHNGFGYAWDLYQPSMDDRNGIHPSDIDPRLSVIKENIVFDHPIGHMDIYISPWYPPKAILVNNWVTENGDPRFINPDLSDTQSATLPDLRLWSSSPAIDAGLYLTQANGSGSASTTLIVDDALYFQDGTWGSDLARSGLHPDWIAVESVGRFAQIARINYETQTITLTTPLSWSDRAPVWLYKNSSGAVVLQGAAPDIGADEYGTALHGADFNWAGRRFAAFPNPAKSQVHFIFDLEQAAKVKVVIMNFAGERVAEVAGDLDAGQGQTIGWDCSQTAPGIYIAHAWQNGKPLAQIKIAVAR